MKSRKVYDTCRHQGHEVNFSYTWWCELQHRYPNEVHSKCDCKNCPDFEPIIVEMESTTSVGTEND